MAYAAFDPVMTGFEQPMTMTPAGQRAAYVGQYPTAAPRAGGQSYTFPTIPGLMGATMALQQRLAAPPVQPAILPAVAPIAGALGAAMPAWLAAILGIGATGFAGYQALGGGEGGGLFGLNILGGDEFMMGGVEFGGPGLAEPLQPYTEWHIGNKQFYHMSQYTAAGKYSGAKVAMYNKDTGKWKVWHLPKPHLAIIGKNMPSHRMLTRLSRNMKRHTADAKTILRVTSPHSLESFRRPGGRYVRGRKRYID